MKANVDDESHELTRSFPQSPPEGAAPFDLRGVPQGRGRVKVQLCSEVVRRCEVHGCLQGDAVCYTQAGHRLGLKGGERLRGPRQDVAGNGCGVSLIPK